MKNVITGKIFVVGDNIDTDQIIPANFLNLVPTNPAELVQLGSHALSGLPDSHERFVPQGAVKTPYTIIIGGRNFGCGSSREHAPWALEDFGIRALIAPSFADIFYNNCFKNGVLPVVLPAAVVEQLFQAVAALPGYRLTIDLEKQTVVTTDGVSHSFAVDEFRKYCLLNGLDEIGLTLRHADDIRAYEVLRAQREPWLFGVSQ